MFKERKTERMNTSEMNLYNENAQTENSKDFVLLVTFAYSLHLHIPFIH